MHRKLPVVLKTRNKEKKKRPVKENKSTHDPSTKIAKMCNFSRARMPINCLKTKYKNGIY